MTRLEKIKLAIEKGYTYNPETGVVKGPIKEINYKQYGYNTISFRHEGKSYKLTCHQFAWYYVYGEIVEQLDHINRDKGDNRISNLRPTNHFENALNTDKQDICKGFYFDKRTSRYNAKIRYKMKSIHLGCFTTEEEAHQAYLDGKKIYHVIE